MWSARGRYPSLVMEGRDRFRTQKLRRAVEALPDRARDALSHMRGDPRAEVPSKEPVPKPRDSSAQSARSLADEVREVQEGRRRRAESAAIRSSEGLEDVLSRTYAAAAERRAEERAEYLLDSDPIEETPRGADRSDEGPSIEVRRRS